MKKLRLTAEVEITEKHAKYLKKSGRIIWDVEKPIATIDGRDIKFISALLVNE